MGNYKSKHSKEKINLNHKIITENETQNEKGEVEIIMELKISDKEKKKEIYILCDKNELIKDNKSRENFYIKNNIAPPKEFNYFNKNKLNYN